MKQFNFSVLLFVLFVFRNGYVSCESIVSCCEVEFITKSFSNTSETKPSVTSKPNTTTIGRPPNPKTKSYNTTTSTASEPSSTYAKTREGILSLFGSKTSLGKLSAPELKSATLRLISYHCSLASRLPDAVVVNLVTAYASTKQLLSSLPQPAVNFLLMLTAVDSSALRGNIVRAQFLNELLSLSPRVLNCVPKSVLVSAIGTVTSPDAFDGLSRAAATNLITVLSLSKSLFNCLPLPTLVSFLTYVSATPAVAWPGFPPSTLFRFFGALLDTLNDCSPFVANRVPHPVLTAFINSTRLMSSRMLSVLPTESIDSLLALLGSSPNLARTLPATHFQSLFFVLKTSPGVLSSLTPSRLAGVLTTVRSCPSILNQLPPNLMNEMLDSVSVYLPSTLHCIPSNAV